MDGQTLDSSKPEKLKVGILTFHNGVNHGAYFQALCLQEYLVSIGFDVQILHYQSLQHFIFERLSLFHVPSLTVLRANFRKVHSFGKAQERFALSHKRLQVRMSSISKTSSYLDYVVVGSDIVWASGLKFLGKLDLYFGAGLKPKVGLVSYAASMGPSRPQMLTHPQALYLTRFNHVSVRDDNTSQAVEAHGVKTELVMDPTFLIDSIGEIRSVSKPNPGISSYLLIYCSPLSKTIKEDLLRFAEDKNLRIVVTGYPQRGFGDDMSHAGPEEWLTLFQGAQYVITNTYHGTIFAILSNVRFITLARDVIENKALYLLRLLRLESRYLYGGFNEKILSGEIKWDRVDELILPERQRSRNFLRNALGL